MPPYSFMHMHTQPPQQPKKRELALGSGCNERERERAGKQICTLITARESVVTFPFLPGVN